MTTPTQEMTLERVQAMLDGSPFIHLLKMRAVSLDREGQSVVIDMPIAPEFERHPYVINGCSELFSDIWGVENGVGVRSAVGFGSLPDNIPVEIEAIFLLR